MLAKLFTRVCEKSFPWVSDKDGVTFLLPPDSIYYYKMFLIPMDNAGQERLLCQFLEGQSPADSTESDFFGRSADTQERYTVTRKRTFLAQMI